MNNKKSIIASVAVAAAMLATSLPAFAYTDVGDSHWAKSYVDDLSGKKYLNGYEDGTFRPDGNISRAEFAKILISIFGDIDKSGLSLSDVKDDAWYADTMKIAVKAGYLYGYDDGTYRPEGAITRQEAAAIVYRAWALSPEGKLTFSDSAKIAEWAANPVATLAAKGIINGYEDGTYRPENYISRAEAAKIISQALTLGTTRVNSTTNTGTTSGAIHVSGVNGTTTRASSTSASSSSSGGGGSSSGKKTKDDSKTVTPADDTDYKYKEGDEQVISEVGFDTSKVADVIGNIPAEEVAADAPVVIELAVAGVSGDKVKVSYLKPAATAGEEPTLTTVSLDEFNEDMKKGAYTKEQAEKIAESLDVKVEDVSAGDVDDITLNVTVKNADDSVVADATAAVDTDSINYVIESMKDFQAGIADNNDLIVILRDLVTKGYSEDEADKWLKAGNNKRALAVYKDVADDVSKVFKDIELTEDNYKQYQGYFTSMIKVVDKGLDKVVSYRGKTLAKADILEYFNNDVVAQIADEVAAEDVDNVAAVAKAFALKLTDKFDDVQEVVRYASSTSDAKKLVLDVYNDNYKG